MQHAADAFDCKNCSCNEDFVRPVGYWKIEDVEGELVQSRKCLRQTLTEQTLYLLSLYPHYKNGLLVHVGGLNDQPAKYIEAMRVIDTRVQRITQETMQNGR